MNACKNAIRRLPKRRAYALVAVLMFNVLFLMLMGVAWRQMVGVIRVATVRAEQVQRDEGVVCAMARAMHMLETGRPPSTPYPCYVKIGSRFFRITFTLAPGPDPSVETWSVTVTTATEAGTPELVDTFPS
jgi:hypothetical protein